MKRRFFKKGFIYSADGPGNRLVYHLSGCNLSCPWCANPEGLFPLNAGYKEMLCEDVLAEAKQAKPLLFDGGGVTFSGGEPTLQFDALKTALQGLRGAGISTAVETNGTCERLSELLPYLSLLIIDVKHHDDEKHRKWTGSGNDVILANLKKADEAGIPVWVRTPLIDGVNADRQDAHAFAKLFQDLALKNASFEFLPYDEYGKPKWEKLGKPYPMQGGALPAGRYDYFKKVFEESGLTVIKT